jgi:hypothetical protein
MKTDRETRRQKETETGDRDREERRELRIQHSVEEKKGRQGEPGDD